MAKRHKKPKPGKRAKTKAKPWRAVPGTLAAIRRVRWHWAPPRNTCPTDGKPYVIDCRSFDITQTVVAMIRNAPPGLAAITLSPRGGIRYVATVERVCRQRGARVIWWPM